MYSTTFNCIAVNATSFIIFDEVYETNKIKLKKVTENFQKKLDEDKKFKGYIINYGTVKETTEREKIIRDCMALRKFDASRITFIRGEKIDRTLTRFLFVPDKESPNSPENKKQNE